MLKPSDRRRTMPLVVIAVILWLLSVFGLMPPLSQIRIG
jgi:hypothetical protein